LLLFGGVFYYIGIVNKKRIESVICRDTSEKGQFGDENGGWKYLGISSAGVWRLAREGKKVVEKRGVGCIDLG